MSGAYTDLDELLACQFAARQLKLFRSPNIRSSLSGNYQSKIKGRGIDFDQVRAYQGGDDIRNIDWRVTARTGKPHTKLFREERERPIHLIVDQSAGMFFGSSLNFKSVTAAQCAALISWAAIEQGDRIGGSITNGHSALATELKPRRHHAHLMHWLKLLEEANLALSISTPSSTDDYLERCLQQARRHISSGSAVIIISDFNHFNAACQQQLFHLGRHNQLLGLCISDPLEQRLPKAGDYTVSDGEHECTINSSHQLQREFAQSFQEQRAHLLKKCRELHMPLYPLSTHLSVSEQLQETFRPSGFQRHA